MLRDYIEKLHFRRAFLTGFVALFPIMLTVLVLLFSWNMIERASKPLGVVVNFFLIKILGFEQAPEGVGTIVAVILAVIFVYVLGRSLAGIFGRRLMVWADGLFSRMPVVSYIYPYAKQLSGFLFGERKGQFNRVVAIEYPRKGIYTIGFVTSDGIEALSRQKGRKHVAVFVATSPTPFTGWTVLVDEKDIIPVDMTVDEAVRFAVTCGVIAPGGEPSAELPTPRPPLPKSAGKGKDISP